MQAKFRSDIGDEFSLNDVSLGEVVYDTMTAEAA